MHIRSYKPWTKKEEQQLIQWRKDRTKITVISVRLQRTYASIQKRLTQLKCTLVQKHYRYSKGDLQQKISRLLKLNNPPIDIAEKLGIDISYVSRVRRLLNIPAKPAVRRPRKVYPHRIKELLEQNKSNKEIAIILQCSESRIHQIKRKLKQQCEYI